MSACAACRTIPCSCHIDARASLAVDFEAGAAALDELVRLARDLGIPASRPRNGQEARALVSALRERVTAKSHALVSSLRALVAHAGGGV